MVDLVRFEPQQKMIKERHFWNSKIAVTQKCGLFDINEN